MLQYTQALLVTSEWQLQSTPLTDRDLETWAWTLDQTSAVGFYNSALDAGASQKHKHMQLVPLASISRHRPKTAKYVSSFSCHLLSHRIPSHKLTLFMPSPLSILPLCPSVVVTTIQSYISFATHVSFLCQPPCSFLSPSLSLSLDLSLPLSFSSLSLPQFLSLVCLLISYLSSLTPLFSSLPFPPVYLFSPCL
jgi:Ap4A phosphorylase N-terminal domain